MAKHNYPSLYPPEAHWSLAEAWKILDSVKPGVISDDIRAFLVGQIAGLLVTLKSDDATKLAEEYKMRADDAGRLARLVLGRR